MIIGTRPNTTSAELDRMRDHIECLGFRTRVSPGERQALIRCIDDVGTLRQAPPLKPPGEESVTPVMNPYKLAAPEFVGVPSCVRVGEGQGAVVGGSELAIQVVQYVASSQSMPAFRRTSPCFLEAFDDFMQRLHRFSDATGPALPRLVPAVSVT